MEDWDMEAEPGGVVQTEVRLEEEEEKARRVQTMPTLPKAPMFHGSTAPEKQKFMKEYEAYCRQLSALETAFFKPFRMPVGACINDESRRLIAMFDIRKPGSEITEAEWINYFWEGRVEGDMDFEKVKTILASSLKMDTKQTDANSRVSKLVHQLYQLLERENMEWMIKSEPKKVERYLIDALAPEQFKSVVKKDMEKESNKPLLKDVVAFTVWLRASCKEYIRWELTLKNKRGTRTGGPSQKGAGAARSSGAPGQTPGSKPSALKPSGPSTKKAPAQSRPCLKCSSTEHRVKDCPSAVPGEAEKLIREWREQKRAAVGSSINALGGVDQASACAAALIEEAVTGEEVLLDAGADTTVVSRGLVRELQRSGAQLRLTKGEPHVLRPFGSKPIRAAWHVIFDKVQLTTAAGPLMLRHLRAWVHEGERETSLLILSHFVMRRLGYSVDALLAEAREKQDEFDLEEMETGEETSGVGRLCRVSSRVTWRDRLAGEEDDEMLPAAPELPTTPLDDDVRRAIAARVAEAEREGLRGEQLVRLRNLLEEYQDVFRLSFGRDPPVRVAPLRVRVREGSAPVKCRSRRYPPEHMRFLERHIDELLKAGPVYVNNSSRYASPPRILPKDLPEDYRMTVDTRAVNAITDPYTWPLQHLEVTLGLLDGPKVYFTLDWFRGYWQLPLHVDSRELFTIMTYRGIVTPTRVLLVGLTRWGTVRV